MCSVSEQVEEDPMDVRGRALARPGSVVAHPCDGAGGIGMDDHMEELVLVLVPFYRGLDGGHFGVKRYLPVPESPRSLGNKRSRSFVVYGDHPAEASGLSKGAVRPCMACRWGGVPPAYP